eukprot:gene13449-19307_t
MTESSKRVKHSGVHHSAAPALLSLGSHGFGEREARSDRSVGAQQGEEGLPRVQPGNHVQPGKELKDRRPLHFWAPFVSKATQVWAEGGPTLQETKVHAKCLRSRNLVREYFRNYRASRKGTGGRVKEAEGAGPEDGALLDDHQQQQMHLSHLSHMQQQADAAHYQHFRSSLMQLSPTDLNLLQQQSIDMMNSVWGSSDAVDPAQQEMIRNVALSHVAVQQQLTLAAIAQQYTASARPAAVGAGSSQEGGARDHEHDGGRDGMQVEGVMEGGQGHCQIPHEAGVHAFHAVHAAHAGNDNHGTHGTHDSADHHADHENHDVHGTHASNAAHAAHGAHGTHEEATIAETGADRVEELTSPSMHTEYLQPGRALEQFSEAGPPSHPAIQEQQEVQVYQVQLNDASHVAPSGIGQGLNEGNNEGNNTLRASNELGDLSEALRPYQSPGEPQLDVISDEDMDNDMNQEQLVELSKEDLVKKYMQRQKQYKMQAGKLRACQKELDASQLLLLQCEERQSVFASSKSNPELAAVMSALQQLCQQLPHLVEPAATASTPYLLSQGVGGDAAAMATATAAAAGVATKVSLVAPNGAADIGTCGTGVGGPAHMLVNEGVNGNAAREAVAAAAVAASVAAHDRTFDVGSSGA